MASRKQDLTEAAQAVAPGLLRRLGTLKLALSAGLIILNKLTPDDRDTVMLEATGEPEEALDLYAEARAIEDIRRKLTEALHMVKYGGHGPDLDSFCEELLDIATKGQQDHRCAWPSTADNARDDVDGAGDDAQDTRRKKARKSQS